MRLTKSLAKSIELVPFYYKRDKQDLEGDTSLPDVAEFHGGHSDIC